MSTQENAALEGTGIAGVWGLVSYTYNADDGSVLHPLGEQPQGFITYTPTGYMSAQLMRSDRKRFAKVRTTPAQPFTETHEEIVDAYGSFVAYSGQYTIDRERNAVTHHLKVSLYPNWEGTSLTRFFEFEGNLLKLSTPPLEVSGKAGFSRVIWERLA
jgi:hypothetical protein